MAGCRLGTGRSAMFTDGPVFGQSGQWGFDPVVTAMSWSPVIGQEISLSGSFLIS